MTVALMPRTGSSPRVRGKLAADRTGGHTERIIPASAGQTCSCSALVGNRSDHPRECGANSYGSSHAAETDGSSPRVRGKHAPQGPGWHGVRIIPASAGQTVMFGGSISTATDHPRECGANGLRQAGADLKDGSSPRVRGKPAVQLMHECRDRIIPASAGQTSPRAAPPNTRPDHPRECGANLTRHSGGGCNFGSSPRVRGKLDGRDYHVAGERIIPASAGQTSHALDGTSSSPDHPRECGANNRNHITSEYNNGSSPRVRGKHRLLHILRPDGRIIPASAGQTGRRYACRVGNADHPRECGANLMPPPPNGRRGGSSPRVRGKRHRSQHLERSPRQRLRWQTPEEVKGFRLFVVAGTPFH